MCAYDPTGLPAGAADAVRLVHPYLSEPSTRRSTSWRSRSNPTYSLDLAPSVPWQDEPPLPSAAEVTVSEAAEVPHARSWLRHQLRHLPQWSQSAAHHHNGARSLEEQVDQLVLATDEVVTNGLRHGQPPVTVRVLAAPDTMAVTVTDAGPGPQSLLAGYAPPRPSRDPDDLTAGGAGLWMARRLCDRVSFSRGPAGFTVHLSTNLPKRL